MTDRLFGVDADDFEAPSDALAERDPKTGFAGWREGRRQRRIEQAAEQQSGMDYLMTTRRKVVTVYMPLFVIVVVLLFPFYWMALTSIKPNAQLVDMDSYNPYWVVEPTLDHIRALLFETDYPWWMLNTMFVAVVATFLSLVASTFAAYAIVTWAFTQAPIALVTALRETSIVFALLIGVGLLKERLDLTKLASIFVTLAGAAMLRLAR